MIHLLKNGVNFSSRLKIFGLLFILFATLAGCEQTRNSQPQSQIEGHNAVDNEMEELNQNDVENNMKDNDGFQFRGKIHRINLEGGFFGIITDKGKKFLPLNLAQSYQQDGAEVFFSGSVNKEIMTIQQWGKPFKISSIKLIKPGKSPVLPTH